MGIDVKARQKQPNSAKTDLFIKESDGSGHIVSDIFPGWMLGALGVTGVLAYLITGFWGYPDDQGLAGNIIFHKPAALFAWFCALIIFLELAILRDKEYRAQRIWALTVTGIAILLVTLFDLKLIHFAFIDQFFRWVTGFVGHGLTYAILNYGALVLLVANNIWRWVAFSRGKSITLHLGFGRGMQRKAAEPQYKITLLDLVSGDVVALGLLALLLSFIFTPVVLNAVNQLIGVRQMFADCPTLFASAHFGPCTTPGDTFVQIPSLSVFDLATSLAAFGLGLIALALTAIITAIRTSGTMQQIVQEVLRALIAAVTHRLVVAFSSLLYAVQQLAWPLIILFSVVGAGAAAKSTQFYFQSVSNHSDCHKVWSLFLSSCSMEKIGSGTEDLLIALSVSAVSALGIIVAVALLLENTLKDEWHVITNSSRFIWQVVKDFVVVFWLFSLALSAVNAFFWLMVHIFTLNVPVRGPFPQLSPAALLSFVLFAVIWWRGRNRRDGEEAAKVVGKLLPGPFSGGRKGKVTAQLPQSPIT